MDDLTKQAKEKARKAYPTGRTIKTSEYSSVEGRGVPLEIARAAFVAGFEGGARVANKSLPISDEQWDILRERFSEELAEGGDVSTLVISVKQWLTEDLGKEVW